MRVDLNGRVALVTGAAAGIGQAIAIAMAQNGASIIAVDISEGAPETLDAVTRMGRTNLFLRCDISDFDQVSRTVRDAEHAFGQIDILVNNAGTNSPAELRKRIDEYSVEEWHRIIAIDLDGLFFCSRAVTPGMVQRNSGTIINIASVMGIIPARLQSAFTAAKAGVINFSRSMALELGPLGIRVNAIAPGSVLTRRTRELFYSADKSVVSASLLSHIPLGRPGTPEEIASAALFLASSDAAYITGTVITVDGGWTAGFAREW
jgi:NAD(P)-dependent dehydrogenase (short-subunit alcohol dehydrogenase family)